MQAITVPRIGTLAPRIDRARIRRECDMTVEERGRASHEA
jgi:hypothetical protein